MAAVQSHQIAFSLALERFKAKLTEKEKDAFQGTTLDDLKVELNKVQQRHCSKRQEVGMKRLEKFLEAMNQYDKVVAVFLNTSAVVAFIWVRQTYNKVRQGLFLTYTGPYEVHTRGKVLCDLMAKGLFASSQICTVSSFPSLTSKRFRPPVQL